MVKYAESMKNLQVLLAKEAEEWHAGPIHISVASSLDNDKQIEIDFSKTIGHRVYKPRNPSDLNCHWLPAHLNDNTELFRKERITPIFTKACYYAGFNVSANWVKKDSCILFTCAKGKFHDEEKNKEAAAKQPRKAKDPSKPPVARDRKTKRPLQEDDEETCKFSFRVYWEDSKKRWFIPHRQSGSLVHHGHSHFESKFLRIQTKHGLSLDEQKLASDCFEAQMSTTATTNLANLRSNVGLEWHQLKYLETRNKNDLVIKGMDPNDAKNVDQVSAADRVLALLNSKPNVSFVALTGELNSGLITLKKRKKGFDNSITIEEFTKDIHDGVDGPSEFAGRQFGAPESELKATTSAKSSNRREVPANLQLKNGQVLLALAWTTDEGKRKFDMYPEFISGDATEDTNSEERPFYTLLGKDNMNKSFAHTWCYMPSDSRWAYTWLFQEAVTSLHPGTACQRVQLIVTDACPQEFFAISTCIGKGNDMSKVYPNAHHRWCGWHKVNRNFTNHPDYKSLLAKVRNSSVENSIEIGLITRMLWYCIKHYETKDELELGLKLIKQYLSEDQSTHYGEIDEDTRAAIRLFFTKSFECNKSMLCEGFFEGVMTFGNCTTGVSEAEHRAYKKTANGVGPADDLAVSAQKIMAMDVRKNAKKDRNITHQLNSKSAKASDREKKAQGLSDFINKQLAKEHEQGGDHLTYREEENIFFVKRDYSRLDDMPNEDDYAAAERETEELFSHINESIDKEKSRSNKKNLKWQRDELFGGGKKSMEEYKVLLCNQIRRVVPRFERTTIVEVRDIPGSDCNEKMLVCARCFNKKAHACRHIYKLLGKNRFPKLTDAHIRWQTSYAHYYGRNGEMSKSIFLVFPSLMRSCVH